MTLAAMKRPIPTLEITHPDTPASLRVLTPGANAFLAHLADEFTERQRNLLAAREQRQAAYDAGSLPDFDPQTRNIREGEWCVAPIPAEVQDRRTEITGPVTRKMMINALNSGAQCYMADFEDSGEECLGEDFLEVEEVWVDLDVLDLEVVKVMEVVDQILINLRMEMKHQNQN